MSDPVDEALALVAELLPGAERLNAILAPLPKRDPSDRAEPLWNAHSMSGGIVTSLQRTRGWLLKAKKQMGE